MPQKQPIEVVDMVDSLEAEPESVEKVHKHAVRKVNTRLTWGR